jgi:hypothetical protein
MNALCQLYSRTLCCGKLGVLCIEAADVYTWMGYILKACVVVVEHFVSGGGAVLVSINSCVK